MNWKDEDAYLKTLDENSDTFYQDRARFFRTNVKDGTISLKIDIVSLEIEITGDEAKAKIRAIVTTTSPLLGDTEQKNTLLYALRKYDGDHRSVLEFRLLRLATTGNGGCFDSTYRIRALTPFERVDHYFKRGIGMQRGYSYLGGGMVVRFP